MASCVEIKTFADVKALRGFPTPRRRVV